VTPERQQVVDRIAAMVVRVAPEHPTRVAVDGITASGKSTLAAELAAAVGALGRPVAHLSMDGFHHLRAYRRRRGAMSADGYYEDAYELAALRGRVLLPLGPGGDRRYVSRAMDLPTDRVVTEEPRLAPEDLVLVVDGTFLQRPELRADWDHVVFVDTSFPVAEDRGAARDAGAFGGEEAAREAFRLRYHAACRRYLAEVDAGGSADQVVRNDDPGHPLLVASVP
jgi:uridine kinase